MRVLMQTDLPLPVAPAIIRWGARARSRMTGLPLISLPRTMGMAARVLVQAELSRMPLRETLLETLLGASMPTVSLPGMGVRMRRLSALRFMAMLFARLLMRSTLTAGAGLIS